MDHLIVWNAVSMAWTEIGLPDEDYDKIAADLQLSYTSWSEIDDIIKGDVLGSFASTSLLLLLAMVSFIGIFFVSLPDWGYEEAELRKRMVNWSTMPRWKRYLNPMLIVGYPLAWLLSISVRKKLKNAFLRRQAES